MNKRLKLSVKVFCLILCAALIASCGGNAANTKTAAETTTAQTTPLQTTTKKAETETKEAVPETVEISVFMYMIGKGDGTDVGIQTDPVAKKIEADTGVKINVVNIQTEGRNSLNILATMMASNDLPDICWVNSGADGKQNIDTLVLGGQIIALDDLIKQNAPYMTTNESWIKRLEEVKNAFGVNGKIYSIPRFSENEIWSTPGNGTFLRWDLYSQIGYPPMNTNDEMVDAIKRMVELEPENSEGLTNYGTGAFFADDPGWGDWVLFENAIQDRGLARIAMTTFVSTDGQKISEVNALADMDSIIWKNVDLFYKLNKAGLLDPDSSVQQYAQFKEKLAAGRYLYTGAGWLTGGYKTQYAGMGKPDAAYLPLAPPEGAPGSLLGWLSIINDLYVVSAKCKNPGKAVQLLDYLSTDEAARMLYCGLEGETWEVVDGYPAYKESFIEEVSNNRTAMAEKYGFAKYGRLASAKGNTILNDGEFADLFKSPRYQAKTYNQAEKDYLNYYKVNNIMEVFTKSDKIFFWEEAANRIPEMDEELQLANTNLINYMYTNLIKIVYAKDDGEYEKLKGDFISGLSEYRVDEIHEFYKSNYSAQVNALKSILVPFEEELTVKKSIMFGN